MQSKHKGKKEVDSIEKIKSTIEYDWSIKLLIGVSIILVVISFLTPYIFTRDALFNIDFSKTGSIGDTIGGIMNPFIAIAAILVTFLAFYIQYKANKMQFALFRLELDNQKLNNSKQEVENRFYEMLKLHKENVSEASLFLIQKSMDSSRNTYLLDNKVSGRLTFELLRKELELIYLLLDSVTPEAPSHAKMSVAYTIFYLGYNNERSTNKALKAKIDDIKNSHSFENYSNLPSIVRRFGKVKWEHELNFELFKGRSSILAHYFRHLFHTVKFIVNQDEELFSYEEKRNYIRLLRAQLSDSEQALMFYNWKSNFGLEWENTNNYFFTDYRMIHNLYDALLLTDFKLSTISEFDRDFKKETGRKEDPLFESYI